VGRALQYEVGTVVSFSAKTLDPKAWTNALNALKSGTTKELELSLRFPLSAFSPYYALRVRGLSASVADPKAVADGDSWRGRIYPPSKAVFTDSTGKETAVMQQSIPCDLARIAARGLARAPDMVGLSHLRNISPLSPTGATDADSAWRLRVSRRSLFGKDLLEITDFSIDLMISGLATPVT
jgi:hypothetical protein